MITYTLEDKATLLISQVKELKKNALEAGKGFLFQQKPMKLKLNHMNIELGYVLHSNYLM